MRKDEVRTLNTTAVDRPMTKWSTRGTAMCYTDQAVPVSVIIVLYLTLPALVSSPWGYGGKGLGN